MKKINFIEKNKELISKKSNNKSDTIIRCLNDIESSKNVVSKITKSNSLINQNEVNSLDNSSIPVDIDISIISNHSSIFSSKSNKDSKLNQGSSMKNVIKDQAESLNNKNCDNEKNSDTDNKEQLVAGIEELVESNEQLYENYEEILDAENNKENHLYQGDECSQDPGFLSETEVNIIKFDPEKSKVRSQFSQR